MTTAQIYPPEIGIDLLKVGPLHVFAEMASGSALFSFPPSFDFSDPSYQFIDLPWPLFLALPILLFFIPWMNVKDPEEFETDS